MKQNSLLAHHALAFLTLSLAFVIVAHAGSGDNSKRTNKRLLYRETPDPQFTAASPVSKRTSPAHRFSTRSFFVVQVNVSDSGRNIIGDAANEPSIAVDPTNPQRMAIGWRQFNSITNSFRQAGYGYTTNGGQTWRFPGVIQPGVFRSDPVLGSDANGNFFYNSLTSSGADFSCDVYPSTTGGATWANPTPAKGGDKQWMVIDTTRGIGRHHNYSNWTSSFSACVPGQFTRSTNRNFSYDNCVTIPGDPFWGTLAVGVEGELFVVGAGDTAFVVAKSTTARNPMQAVSWDTVSVVYLDGEVNAFGGPQSPNPSGLHGQAWIAVDHSGGATRGNVYVLCSVERNSNSDPLDVMFSRSTNNGRTWSAPIRVNDDASQTAWQWFGTMSVAPNGRIDVVWLDTRDNPGSVRSSLYYSYSTNGGVSWSRNERLSMNFDPHVGWPQQQKMGDYFHMVSDNTAANLAWAATFNGEQDVYYGRISFTTNARNSSFDLPAEFSLEQNYPNPFNPTTTIGFAVRDIANNVQSSSVTTLKVYDILGREVATLVNDELLAGSYWVEFNAESFASGVYYYRLTSGGNSAAKRMILMR